MSADLSARIERIEAQLAIQQLPPRYAVAVDSRNLDDLVALFAPDVDCGRWGNGREALKAFYEPTLRHFYRSQHQICGHVVDLIDVDHARGATYCRAEHEDGNRWYVMAICYFDEYQRYEGQWCFKRRAERHWFSTDETQRPNDGESFQRWPRHSASRYQPKLKQQDFKARLAQTPQELEEILAPIADAVCDLFEASVRYYKCAEFEGSPMNLAGWAKKVTGKFSMTVGGVGLNTGYYDTMAGQTAAAVVDFAPLLERFERGEFDLVEVGRALLHDPAWTNKLRTGGEFLPFQQKALETLT